MSDELVKDARSMAAIMSDMRTSESAVDILNDCAARIAALEAQVRELEAERDEAISERCLFEQQWRDAETALATERATVARLLETLGVIVGR